MRSSEVYEVIKTSVKINVAYIDKVIIICSGRIEGPHVDSITQFMKWLKFSEYKKKFVFVYNKCDGKTEAVKFDNLTYMCNVLGANQNPDINCCQNINQNLALGFPPNASYEDVKKDHTKLTDAASNIFYGLLHIKGNSNYSQIEIYNAKEM